MDIEKMYEMYKVDAISRKKFNDGIIEYAYNQVSKDRYIEAGDFIVEFIPRVNSIIDKYNTDLASFTHYLNKHIKWIMFSFNKAYVIERDKVEACKYHYITEFKERLCVTETPVEYKITEKAKKLLLINNGKVGKETIRKRLEIFTLKNSRVLSYEQINLLASLLDRPPRWLFDKIEVLNNLCYKRVHNRDYLRERYNRLFIEVTRIQKKINTMEESYEKEVLSKNMQEKQERKNLIELKLNNRNCGPKNEEVAQVLGIPKGTVDSSLFYLKKALKSLLPTLDIL
ncbi:hypothetical protein EW093_12445 [Thiospirochaeta perfilievii]|uniref:Uncharacterized protein n=1 Tax=Thiospirochaeta perfilievii TaxID=252967 RepID=A0A5C1QEQ0_9SPIO|nr:hypothetical protein [Thiospirochaeta perfilievii]QEN05489.1 hypothetical protein EW093_12445 [Thiospirochaeta perfilievii]